MKEIHDAKLLARVKKLIRAEHAGYIRGGNKCVEPGCSCNAGLGENDPDPVSGPFRTPAVRCSSFETLVLPLDPDLETAYWDHLKRGARLQVIRCQHEGCRKAVSAFGPNTRYCAIHARLRAKQATRERVRRYREGEADQPSNEGQM